MDGGVLALLLLAFGLGLLHALDADHVMAVSALASLGHGRARAMGEAARWALGHGAVVLVLGALAIGLGLAIPPGLADAAEIAVGLVLVALGVWVLLQAARRGAHIHFHRHDGLPAHAHWHAHGDAHRHGATDAESHRHAHRATFVGALHGAAGSAPLLAVVPATTQGSVGLGIAYLVTFGLGVGVAMVAFGGLLGAFLARVETGPLARCAHAATGLGSVGLGLFWLVR